MMTETNETYKRVANSKQRTCI